MPYKDLITSEQQMKQFRKKDKVAIIGFADTWNQAPYDDPSFEIWGLNSLFEVIPAGKWDLWFEIHERVAYKMDTNKEVGYGLTRTGQPYMEALSQLKGREGQPTPILMVDCYDDIPASVKYPIEEIAAKYGNYFTNSISYMIALAVDWGYPEMHIYGVDMATYTEYGSQRPSCEYYLGIAIGRGVKLYIPPAADLLKARCRYGMEQEKEDDFVTKIRNLRQSMSGRANVSKQNLVRSQSEIDQYIGADAALAELEKIWSAGNSPMPYPLLKPSNK